jgi:hypothetical protein
MREFMDIAAIVVAALGITWGVSEILARRRH